LRHAVFGVPYLCLPVAALIGLRAEETYGVLCIFWILIVIWITDTGAFFGGRAMGGPKLAPAVSPDKTWSGALTGVATAFVAGATYAWAVDLPAPMIIGLVSIAVSISGQLGDLLESGLKRRFNVKDSGTLIPGHGGVLDRIDSLVTAVTFVWVLGALRAGYDSAASGALVW